MADTRPLAVAKRALNANATLYTIVSDRLFFSDRINALFDDITGFGKVVLKNLGLAILTRKSGGQTASFDSMTWSVEAEVGS